MADANLGLGRLQLLRGTLSAMAKVLRFFVASRRDSEWALRQLETRLQRRN